MEKTHYQKWAKKTKQREQSYTYFAPKKGVYKAHASLTKFAPPHPDKKILNKNGISQSEDLKNNGIKLN